MYNRYETTRTTDLEMETKKFLDDFEVLSCELENTKQNSHSFIFIECLREAIVHERI